MLQHSIHILLMSMDCENISHHDPIQYGSGLESLVGCQLAWPGQGWPNIKEKERREGPRQDVSGGKRRMIANVLLIPARKFCTRKETRNRKNDKIQVHYSKGKR